MNKKSLFLLFLLSLKPKSINNFKNNLIYVDNKLHKMIMYKYVDNLNVNTLL